MSAKKSSQASGYPPTTPNLFHERASVNKRISTGHSNGVQIVKHVGRFSNEQGATLQSRVICLLDEVDCNHEERQLHSRKGVVA